MLRRQEVPAGGRNWVIRLRAVAKLTVMLVMPTITKNFLKIYNLVCFYLLYLKSLLSWSRADFEELQWYLIFRVFPCAGLGKAQVMLIANSMTNHMASQLTNHAYSWNIIGWRHLTHAQFAYFGQAGHAILDEHDSQATAFRPTARL